MKFLSDYFEKVNIQTPFRVCYHHLNNKLNCSVCTKCYRAIITLIILGKDPRKYGFDVINENHSIDIFYDNLMNFIKKNVFNINDRDLLVKKEKLEISEKTIYTEIENLILENKIVVPYSQH
mgnify:CR=1 FL=1